MSSRHCILLSGLLGACVGFAAEARKPVFQYQTEGIQIPVPVATEPRVKEFSAATVKAAGTYLDNGAICWVREKTCVNCHTTGPYMSERPALTAYLGKPNEEVLADFVKSIPAKPAQEAERDGVRYYPGANTSVWRTMGLAEWDKHVTGRLSEHTERSLRDMMMRMSDHGAFVAMGEVEIPHITTDFELTLQAARAITAAPGWLKGLRDEEIERRVSRMKEFLRITRPRNDYERVLRLQLASYMPELVQQEERDTALKMLRAKQLPDGGWSLRRMSDTGNWRTPMSATVLKLIASQPDAASPESDAYMTAFAIVLMREAGVPAGDEQIQRGIAWLKKEQRESGRWWMQSLYRGNYQFFTYIATCQALKALALCDALPH